jgi:hypothetical protein
MDVVQQQLDRLGFRPYASGFRPYSEDEVLAYERLLGRRLPEDFRWFARTYGEGYLGGDEPSIGLSDGERIHYDRLGGDLRYRDLYVEPAYPAGLVACASDVMGDVFFLTMHEVDDCGVWFWGYYEGKNPHTELVRVADGFTDLLSRTVLD